MKKYEDGRIGFESDLRHRLSERLRSALKSKGYVVRGLKSKNRSTIKFEITKDGMKKKIFGLIRERLTNNVAININDYNDLTFDNDTYIVLLDRRHLYKMKYATTSKIKAIFPEYYSEFVLIPEEQLTSGL